MIELKGISKTYFMGKVEVNALKDVSLRISCGEFVAVMGPSGSGKSTLMHILGLLDRPDCGSYLLEGEEITGLSEERLAAIRNRLVGFVFQQFHLLPRLSALLNVELPLVYAGKRHLKDKAVEKIGIVGLSDRMSHRPAELSGGQQQRVAIARSLVNDPLIIMADEPTGNLDSKSQEEIMGIFKKLNQEGSTIILVTHEREVAQNARRIIGMRDGRIISDQIVSKLAMTIEGKHDQGCKDAVSASSAVMGGAKFIDYLREAVSSILAHKMRAALSIIGVLIGVGAVIAMLALGEGAKSSIESQLASLGSNLLVVRPGSSRIHGVALESGSVTRFTFQDVQAIRKIPELVRRISPAVTARGQVVHGNKNWNTQVEGVDVDYAYMRASVPVVGRFFDEHEVKLREKVALLGPTVARELFGESNPVGEMIKINLVNFKVLGVLPAKGSSGWRDQDDTILIPITTAMFRLMGKEYLDTIYVEAKNAQVAEELSDRIVATISRLHRLSAEEAEDAFQIRNLADIRNALESTTKTMSMLLGSIAAISLLVGGIGIMNIMLVSVTERTREIGLRKAIGANNRDIMTQFLIEAVLMSLLGGAGGISLGVGAAILINVFAGWSARVSLFSVLLAAVFSFVVGVVFGIWPAKQAAQLNPIEALRYE